MISTEKKHTCSRPCSQEGKLLGDYILRPDTFPDLEEVFQEFFSDGFKNLNEKQRGERVNKTLLSLINGAPQDSFLLPAVVDYIDRVRMGEVLDTHYTFAQFEFWLNQFSELNEEDNNLIRAKIIGKRIPREDYQALFPIGMGKMHAGTHFVSAHLSPDLDTTVASFWGWVDAFGARVGGGLHLWNLPGGSPPQQITVVLKDFYGEALFTHVAISRTLLSLSGIDFVTQKSFIKKHAHELTSAIDHGRSTKAVILVDEQGCYCGDWRSSDVELVRQVVLLLNNCLRWFENNLHVKLISLFAKENLSMEDIPVFISTVFDLCIKDCEPARDYSEEQKQYLQDYLCKVLGVKKGLKSTFGEFGKVMDKLSISEFLYFRSMLESLGAPEFFDRAGYLRENRPSIFNRLEQVIKSLDDAIQSIRNYVDRLDVAINIKHQVLGYKPEYVTLRDDVEEIRSKMGSHQYLSVIYPDKEGRLLPMGVIMSSDFHKPVLGTVSLRDFCNRDEIKIAPYLEVISVVDHHRSGMQTSAVPVMITGDVQSSNVLLAEQAFLINDRHSFGGMSPETIETQLKEESQKSTLESLRLCQRLLKRRMVPYNEEKHFIHPKREYVEYLSFLHAILDDTDLLSKVTNRDVECVASLLNRLKSLILGKETEVVCFDDLPKDGAFAKKAAQRLLQNEELYSLYKIIYEVKEEEIERNLELCAAGSACNLFADTKEQNGCSRVGQTKLFARNFTTFSSHASAMRSVWLKDAQRATNETPQVDLHIHMISTVSGAREVYRAVEYAHQDELWLWVPPSGAGYDHLASYLSAFKQAPEVMNNQMEVEFCGSNARELGEIFTHHFLNVPQKMPLDTQAGLPIAIVRFRAGSLNSRKSMITPYIPTLTQVQ